MALFLRFTLSVTLVLGTFAGLGFFQPQWAESMGLDFWHLAKYQSQLNNAASRCLQLEKVRLVQREKTEQKEKIVTMLIANQLTLDRAIDEIRAVSTEDFLENHLKYANVEGDTNAVRLARLVVAWANRMGQRELNENQLAEMEARLNRQLTAYLIQLPDRAFQ